MSAGRAVWLVIADDLTGACDTGSAFTRAWKPVKVVLDPGQGLPEADVLVLDSESRSLAEDEAAAAVARLVKSAGVDPDCRVYKKIDSTLRGNPWVELGAVMRELDVDRALVAPAFPEQGRTVSHGVLKVRGVPLAETVFGEHAAGLREGLAQCGATVNLLALEDVRRGADYLSQKLAGAGPGILLVDAETTGDLRALAQAFLGCGLRLACGSAGLARSLVDEAVEGKPGLPVVRRSGPVLVVSGSCHPQTVAQVEQLRHNGTVVFSPTLEDFRIAGRQAELIHKVASALAGRQAAGIDTSLLPYAPGQEQQVAAELGLLVLNALAQAPVGGLVLTGGDTAAATCRALGSRVIDLGGEILPGLPWGRLEGGRFPGLMVATKAGGFGNDDALLSAVRWFNPQASSGLPQVAPGRGPSTPGA